MNQDSRSNSNTAVFIYSLYVKTKNEYNNKRWSLLLLLMAFFSLIMGIAAARVMLLTGSVLYMEKVAVCIVVACILLWFSGYWRGRVEGMQRVSNDVFAATKRGQELLRYIFDGQASIVHYAIESGYVELQNGYWVKVNVHDLLGNVPYPSLVGAFLVAVIQACPHDFLYDDKDAQWALLARSLEGLPHMEKEPFIAFLAGMYFKDAELGKKAKEFINSKSDE